MEARGRWTYWNTGMLDASDTVTQCALRLIRAARVAHLATADANGQPLVIPICFAFDGKEFFSPIDEKPKQLSPQSSNDCGTSKRIRKCLWSSIDTTRTGGSWPTSSYRDGPEYCLPARNTEEP